MQLVAPSGVPETQVSSNFSRTSALAGFRLQVFSGILWISLGSLRPIPTPKANKLFHISVRPGFNHLHRKAWNSAQCAFKRHRESIVIPNQALAKRSSVSGPTHQLASRFFAWRSGFEPHAGSFALRFLPDATSQSTRDPVPIAKSAS